MLSEPLKSVIQEGYRQFLDNRKLRPRLGQRQMIGTLATFFGKLLAADRCDTDKATPHICAVEAGTGTGKTVAYLLALLPVARETRKTVVIATATVALQTQLLAKDIPDLMAATGWDYKFALAKGRGRYLCPLRLEQALDMAHSVDAGQFLFPDEVPFRADRGNVALVQAMDVALRDGQWQGDRDEWPEAVADDTWRAVTIDRKQCSGHRCRLVRECCYFRARDLVEDAHCIVANHDLVMADLALGGGVILPAPEDTIYVFDEAHRLGATALGHFARQCQLHATATWLGKLVGQITALLPKLENVPQISGASAAVTAIGDEVEVLLQQHIPVFERYLQDVSGTRYRYPGGVVDSNCREVCVQLSAGFSRLFGSLDKLHREVEKGLDDAHSPVPRSDLEQYFQTVGLWLRRAESAALLWRDMGEVDQNSEPPLARWVARDEGSDDIRVCASPITAQSLLQDHLWERCYGAVLTSATLCSLGSFERLRRDCGLPENTLCETVAGAFDYAQAAVLAVPAGVEASDVANHTAAVVAALPQLCAMGLGTLVLFASRRQLQDVAERLEPDLRARLLIQGELTVAEIVSRHRQRVDAGDPSVIFGLASFAEGMDLPGTYCEHVIIAKLPFAVPDDPLQEALAEWVESRGGNAFREVTLPDASLKLVQASGRLLRTEEDRGRVTILDRRLLSKGYGRQLLADLPPFRREFD